MTPWAWAYLAGAVLTLAVAVWTAPARRSVGDVVAVLLVGALWPFALLLGIGAALADTDR